MPVFVDAMGGDYAPEEIVKGAVAAAREYFIDVVLVGDENSIREYDVEDSRVSVVHASETIGMNEHPAKSIRRKPDSSIAVAARLAKDTRCPALVSAGHTGAVMAAALLLWGRVPGIDRPGIACVIPTGERNVVVLDVGANVDCKPSHLLQFAIMGTAYARFALKVEEPTVGLLNIGEEEKKGNEQSLATYNLLKSNDEIIFKGNVEPSAVYAGMADVVVTDGFAGNIFLKSSEAVSDIIQRLVKTELANSGVDKKTTAVLFNRLAQYSTRNPEHAGAPLLGVNGTCVIAHGGSSSETIKQCVGLAHRYSASSALSYIKNYVSK